MKLNVLLCLLVLLCFGAASAQPYQYSNQVGSSIGNYMSSNVNGYTNISFPGISYNFTFPSYGFNETYNASMSNAFSFFSEYYINTGTPIVGGIVSVPVQFNIAQRTPSRVYLVSGQAIPYSQYTSMVVANSNQLWIQGATDWSQYVISPVGTWLQLVAYTPNGGNANVYDIIQTSGSAVKYRQYQLYPGYNSMNFYVGDAGRHMLYFIVNNQPSNIVVIDAAYQAQPSTETVTPLPAPYPGYTPMPAPTPTPTPTPLSGNVPVTIRYPDTRSFDVYVDGAYVGSGIGGSFSFSAPAGSHDIRVWDGSFDYEKTVYLQSGIPKIIYVEGV